MMLRLLVTAFVFGTLMVGTAQAATEIQFWHAMGGTLGEKLNEIADEFNASQDDYEVKPVYKGNYTETMMGAIAAFRAGEQPAIVQVFEVGTATMMAAKGAIYPVYKLMEDSGTDWDPNAYLPAVKAYYTTTDGKMLSMPFNSSTPVLYYNKDAFEAAGLDPNKPPRTWKALVSMSKKIIDSGAAECGFTTGWQSWVQLENLGAWHNTLFATENDGFGGLDAKLLLDQPLFVRHIGNMAEWQSEDVYRYGGRGSDADPLFFTGTCAMLMDSSSSYSSVKGQSDFTFGISYLPYYDDVGGAPQNSIIGGASLWVLQGQDDDVYKGVAAFFKFLSSAEVQADWHQFTGYVPITTAAYELSREQGFYKKNPGTDIAIKQLTYNKPTPASKGLRLGNFAQIRNIINDELEAVWSGKKTAEQALTAITKRGNKLLREFQDRVE